MSFESAKREHADSWVSFPTGVPQVLPSSGMRKPNSATSAWSWSIEISPSPTVAADDGSFAQAANSTTTHRIASTRTGRGRGITGSS